MTARFGLMGRNFRRGVCQIRFNQSAAPFPIPEEQTAAAISYFPSFSNGFHGSIGPDFSNSSSNSSDIRAPFPYALMTLGFF